MVPNAARYSRRELDELVEQAKQFGAAGLVWARRAEGDRAELGAQSRRRGRRFAARSNWRRRALADLLLMAAGTPESTSKMLGQLRLHVAKKENLLDPNAFAFLWVVDFPMFEWLEERSGFEFMHHPFTSPLESDAGCSRPIRAARGPAPTTSC